MNSKILHEIKQNKPGKIYTLCYVKNNLLKLQRDLLKVRIFKQKNTDVSCKEGTLTKSNYSHLSLFYAHCVHRKKAKRYERYQI